MRSGLSHLKDSTIDSLNADFDFYRSQTDMLAGQAVDKAGLGGLAGSGGGAGSDGGAALNDRVEEQ